MACVARNTLDYNNFDGTGSYWVKRSGACQPAPYTKPLAYTFDDIRTDYAKKSGIYTSFGGLANAAASKGSWLVGPNSLSTSSYYLGLETQAINKCLDKFYNELDEQAMLAVNFAERAQSANMMASRLFQLARFGRALRKFDLITAAKSLGLDPHSGIPVAYAPGKKPKGWSKAKARSKIVADAWLEFHFGWEPLVKDIFHATQVLQSPMSGKTVEARTGVPFLESSYSKPYSEAYIEVIKGIMLHKCGATLLVTDHNAYMANRLGLTNPAAWAWELIPFSFVVDWFSTVGSFINQWTDLDGVRLIDPWNATTLIVEECYYGKRYTSSALDILSHGVLFRRRLGIARYKIAFRPLKRLSLVRAATAIALLTQFLPR